jgi:hypothetical protein
LFIFDNSQDFNMKEHNRNYGSRQDGPWVLGMVLVRTRECRYFYVERRDRATLHALIKK